MHQNNNKIYFDYCATTPVDSEVKEAMLPALEDVFGNPSSMHWAGKLAAEKKEAARKEIADILNCVPDELVFTSGATEADNLALFGIMKQYAPGDAHLITCVVEHHAVLHAASELEKQGYAVTYLPVDGNGLVDPGKLQSALRPQTRLVSIMYVNNEMGSIQPIFDLSSVTHQHGALFHTDAVQGLYINDHLVSTLNIDLLSFSGHKIYGPKGIGALFVRKELELVPQIIGGPQERGLRAGTENIPGILGLAAAIKKISRDRNSIFGHLRELRRYFLNHLKQEIPTIFVNGDAETTAPHILSIIFPGAVAEMMLLHLSQAGFAVSLGSACTSKDVEPSHVLTALGWSRKEAEATLRISFGVPTTKDEVDQLIDILPGIYQQCKE